MRIGIDIRHLSTRKHTGIEEYTYNLLPCLFRLGKNDQFILLYNSYNRPVPHRVREWAINYPHVKIADYCWPSKVLNGLLLCFGFPKLDNLVFGVDVFFFPNIAFSAISSSVPTVLTFHDLSFEILPYLFNPYRRLWHFLVNPRKSAHRSTALITVSRSTAEDLKEIYQIPEEKINPIYLGVDKIFLKSNNAGHLSKPGIEEKIDLTMKLRYGLPEKPFILYFGTLEPRKNITGLIRAFEIFKSKTRSSHKLVIAGTIGWSYKEIFFRASRSKYKREIFFSGTIKDEDRPHLYKMADLFVFPSFLEGFGLPPLEAIASGVPVICSNSSSLLEIMGDTALMINSYDIGELAWAIERGVSDSVLRKDLIAKGLVFAQFFTWKKTAEKTLAVLHRVAGLKKSNTVMR